MIKIINRTFLSLIIILLFISVYLSVIGFRTDKFNPKIISQVNQIDPNIKLKLNDVIIKLDPFNFKINAKTLGTDLSYKNKTIKVETIQSKISIKSLIYNNFYLSEIFISTKPLIIRDLIIFARLLNNNFEFDNAERLIKKGYLIADLKMEFDDNGKIKNNFKFNGFVKDGEINLFEKYEFNKIDFNFKIEDKELKFNDLKIAYKNKNILVPELTALKKNSEYFLLGKLISNNLNFSKEEINEIFDQDLIKLDINEILFSSKNDFKFQIDKDFKLKNLDIKSDINLNTLKFKNSFKLKKFFPEVKNFFVFKNQKLRIEYKNDSFSVSGSGEALLQKEIDKIEYIISKKKDQLSFSSKMKILKNPFELNFLNYKKIKNSELNLSFKGKSNGNDKLKLSEITLKENNNLIFVNDLILTNDYKIYELGNIKINYTDKEDLKNNLELEKKDEKYFISGDSFNINNLINDLLDNKNDKDFEFFYKDFKFFFDVKKINLDKNNSINDLKGFLSLNKNKISELDLKSKFSNNEIIKFTIKEKGKEKITTLYSYRAKPFVDRYKFIKGFEEGDLDFYSSKKDGLSKSILKIDNFKIREIPVLAKLLTLASLQGIADLLTGEGIRFTDFEMKYSSKDQLMVIEELYAIGPAISILMEGYIQKQKLISLRGTLVPATTVNRTISSIPLIGDILVGKKVGEGVFGVSFKIKGPPGDLETTVNPIKSLTPRFITRTLEKIKNN